MRTRTTDIAIEGSGFYKINGLTPKGRKFMQKVQGTEDGIAYCDDSRLTQDIADGAVSACLRVEVNGVMYGAH